MSTLAVELDALSALAKRINLLPGANRHNPGVWYHERDEIARSIARAVGRLRKELGLRDPAVTSFAARLTDSGVPFVHQARGAAPNRQIPVERRGKVPTRHMLETALRSL